ncbi:MAG: hypothetical protein LBN01_04500 [Endomicrobium sp.]|nr:hypothetical protein [Endomicrobium sp.]
MFYGTNHGVGGGIGGGVNIGVDDDVEICTLLSFLVLISIPNYSQQLQR